MLECRPHVRRRSQAQSSNSVHHGRPPSLADSFRGRSVFETGVRERSTSSRPNFTLVANTAGFRIHDGPQTRSSNRNTTLSRRRAGRPAGGVGPDDGARQAPSRRQRRRRARGGLLYECWVLTIPSAGFPADIHKLARFYDTSGQPQPPSRRRLWTSTPTVACAAMAGRCPMSDLRDALSRYLEMRRGLGYRLKHDERDLVSFANSWPPTAARTSPST